MKVSLFFESAGVAILALLPFLWEFLLPDHLVIYHNLQPVSTITGSLAIILLLAIVFALILLFFLDRFDPGYNSLGWAAVLIWAFARSTGNLFFLLSYYDVETFPGRHVKTLLQYGIAAIVLFLWWRLRGKFQSAVRASRVLFFSIGCCVVWMLPQLVAITVHCAAPVQSFSRPKLKDSVNSSSARIVWVLFDELSYAQVFEHPQPGLSLPNFEQFKKKSVSFANVQPAGYFTDIIVPSLFLGRRLDKVRSSIQGDLFIYPRETQKWEPFRPDETVFHDAQHLGWSTGVAGWYNPYCHILASVLDFCFWESINPFFHGMSDRAPMLVNVRDFLVELSFSRIKGNSASVHFASNAHAQEYENILPAAEALAGNDAIRFAFIHLPVPHPPGIYNRATHTYSEHGTYLDNLVLADQTFGALLQALKHSGGDSHTILIVSSDHSWRVGMWKMNNTTWTKEEERASGGKFDPRPVLMVHFPDETTGETIAQPFAEIKTRQLIDAMLQGQLHSPQDLDRWLATK